MKKLLYLFILVVALPILTGCVGIKPGATKGGKNLVETFYVGEEGTQYFVKPLTFVDVSDSDKELLLDVIFRYRNEVKGMANLNFSLVQNTIVKNLDSLLISNSTISIRESNIELLFNEKRHDMFYSRFSTQVQFSDFNKLFEDLNWQLHISSGKESTTYIPSKKAKKALATLQANVFILF